MFLTSWFMDICSRDRLFKELSHWLFSGPATYKFKGLAFHTREFQTLFLYSWHLQAFYTTAVGAILTPLRWAWASFALPNHWAAPGPLGKDHEWCLLQHVLLELVTTELARSGGWEINTSCLCSCFLQLPCRSRVLVHEPPCSLITPPPSSSARAGSCNLYFIWEYRAWFLVNSFQTTIMTKTL